MQLLEERNNKKDEKLKEEITKLNNIIINLQKENNIIKKNSINDINELKDKIKILSTDINNKYKEINYYKNQVQNSKENQNEITSIKPGEKIISVQFISQGINDIFNYGMACKNTDLFVKLEERLYNDFPKYKKLETLFEVNGRRILRFQTLDENKIKNNDIINLFFNEI